MPMSCARFGSSAAVASNRYHAGPVVGAMTARPRDTHDPVRDPILLFRPRQRRVACPADADRDARAGSGGRARPRSCRPWANRARWPTPSLCSTVTLPAKPGRAPSMSAWRAFRASVGERRWPRPATLWFACKSWRSSSSLTSPGRRRMASLAASATRWPPLPAMVGGLIPIPPALCWPRIGRPRRRARGCGRWPGRSQRGATVIPLNRVNDQGFELEGDGSYAAAAAAIVAALVATPLGDALYWPGDEPRPGRAGPSLTAVGLARWRWKPEAIRDQLAEAWRGRVLGQWLAEADATQAAQAAQRAGSWFDARGLRATGAAGAAGAVGSAL